MNDRNQTDGLKKTFMPHRWFKIFSYIALQQICELIQILLPYVFKEI